MSQFHNPSYNNILWKENIAKFYNRLIKVSNFPKFWNRFRHSQELIKGQMNPQKRNRKHKMDIHCSNR